MNANSGFYIDKTKWLAGFCWEGKEVVAVHASSLMIAIGGAFVIAGWLSGRIE